MTFTFFTAWSTLSCRLLIVAGSQIHEVSVPLSKEFDSIRNSFLLLMKSVLGRLVSTKATSETNPEKLNSMMLLNLKESLRTYERPAICSCM